MPVDRLLNTVLQHYQDVHDAAKTDQIVGSTVQLLTRLSNPLNLALLTSQLLTAPAIWHRRDGTKSAALRVIGIYNTAAARVRDHEIGRATRERRVDGGGLRSEAWTRAVVKGADARSRRWQHLLVLAGLLTGMEGSSHGQVLSRALRDTLEQAVVTAANLALGSHAQDGPAAAASIVTALNLVFPLLSDHHRARIHCDALLPLAVWAMTGEGGFCDGQFLGAIDRDITVQPAAAGGGSGGGGGGHVLAWPAQSPSCSMLREMEKQPSMANMGPLSKLAAFAVQHAKDTSVVLRAQDALLRFTGHVLDAWQENRLSGHVLDAWQENRLSGIDDDALRDRDSPSLSPETAQTTWPLLWHVLRKLLFGTTAVLQAIVARSLLLGPPRMLLARGTTRGGVASKSLHILRNLFFISSRDGNGAFQVYTFTYMACLDVLSSDAPAAEAFLRGIRRPAETAPVAAVPPSTTPLGRTLDLYYLHVAEHLPLSLPTDACEALIVRPAMAYLSPEEGGPELAPSMMTTDMFESAHSVVLSAMSCPRHSALTIEIAPFYLVKLFESFPRHISARQFRVAFKTVLEMVSPPFPVAAMDPHLSETLLEMLRAHLSTAGTHVLPRKASLAAAAAAATTDAEGEEEALLSEQSALVTTLIDSLPFLPLPLVEEWLGITARALNEIEDARLRTPVRKRLLDVLVGGEMDVERAAVGLVWWGTKGGRELVLSGRGVPPPKRPVMTMSGARSGDATSSRL
ncbi:hypothetical protein E4U41_000934 [Claviceps citrina]|nr:hypothetical protein E4U41_000934 [Claviceps citrina]